MNQEEKYRVVFVPFARPNSNSHTGGKFHETRV